MASPNKVNTVTFNSSSMIVGNQLIITVMGNTGGVGNAGIMWFNPSVYGDWPADSLELANTSIEFAAVLLSVRLLKSPVVIR